MYLTVMNTTATAPETLLEAVRYFADSDIGLNFLAGLRWPDGAVKCPTCGSEHVTFLRNQRRWKCYEKHPVHSSPSRSARSSRIPLSAWTSGFRPSG